MRDEFLVDGVHHATLHPNDHRLVASVAYDHTLKDAFRHHTLPPGVARRRSPSTVLMRAMLRRTCRTRAVFSSWPFARWKRRLKISLPKASSSPVNSSSVLALASVAFIRRPPRLGGRRSALQSAIWRRRGRTPPGRYRP